jgi:hypothetical protein
MRSVSLFDSGATMTDDEIRDRVRAKLADGTLPRDTPVMFQQIRSGQPTPVGLVAGSSLADPCAVCGESSTQIRYNAAAGPIAFHERCHRIWREEADKLW